MKDLEQGGYGWIIEESKNESSVELGTASSKQMLMMLSFFHEGGEYSKEHKELWTEMCNANNNILDDIIVWEREGEEVVTVMQGEKSMNIIANSKGFVKTIVKDSVSGKIGLLLIKGGNDVMGSRTMNVIEMASLACVSAFIYKDGDNIYVMDMQDNVDKYILPKEKVAKKEIPKEKILTTEDITKKDIEALSKEIKNIDVKYIEKLAVEHGDNPEVIANKLFEDGHISQRAKEVIKIVGLMIDIV